MNLLTSIQNLYKYNIITAPQIVLTFMFASYSPTVKAICSADGVYIYLWNVGGSIRRSTNSGVSFTQPSFSGGGVSQMVCSQSGQYVAVITTANRLLYSTNYAQTWTQAVQFSTLAPTIGGSIDFSNVSGALYMFGGSSLGGSSTQNYNHSLNGGQSIVVPSLTTNSAPSYVRGNNNGSTLYYVSTNTLRRLTNLPTTTTLTDDLIATFATNPTKLDINRNSNSTTYFLLVSTTDVFFSNDGGSSFSSIKSNTPFSNYTQFRGCAVSFTGQYMAVATNVAVIIYSKDYGNSWQILQTAGSMYDVEFAGSAENENLLLVSTTSQGIFKCLIV